MRVERVETIAYALPFREPYATARGVLERREMVLLRLYSDSGVVGLGEAVPLALRGGDDLTKVLTQLQETATRLVGLELGPAGEPALDVAIATVLELTRPRRLAPPSAAALECAVFDLAAKESGVPLWRLLGATTCEPVRCNATLTMGEPDAVAAQALAWAVDGYDTFKLKLGGKDDAAQARAVRDAVGTGPAIRVDANEAWSPEEAEATLAELEPLGIELAEQPVQGLRALARLANRVGIPLAADESVTTEADAHRARDRGACKYATVKLCKVGGIGAASAIAAVLPTYLSSALDGPVGIAAAAHLAQVLRERGDDPGIAHGLATQRLFSESVATRECRLEDGFAHLPDGSGLGVELDDQALNRCAIAAG